MLEIISDIASDGRPVNVRTWYAAYRQKLNVTPSDVYSQKLKDIVVDICNGIQQVEYIILQNKDEPELQSFVPCDKSKSIQPPQQLAGKVSVGDQKMLYFYRNSIPRAYAGSKKRALSSTEGNGLETVLGLDPVPAPSKDNNHGLNTVPAPLNDNNHGLDAVPAPLKDNNNEFPDFWSEGLLSGSFSYDGVQLSGSSENSRDSINFCQLFRSGHVSAESDTAAEISRSKTQIGSLMCPGRSPSTAAGDGGDKGLVTGGGGGSGGGGGVGGEDEDVDRGSVNDGGGDEGDEGGGGGGDDDGGGDGGGGGGGGDGGGGGGPCLGREEADLVVENLDRRLIDLARVAADQLQGYMLEREKDVDSASGPACSMCGTRECEAGYRACPNCNQPICHTCASITNGLLRAVESFLKNLSPAWKDLHCLSCQRVEDFDRHFMGCLDDVRQATAISLKAAKSKSSECQELWFHVGLLYAVGGPFSGVYFPDEFRQGVEAMLRHEVKQNRDIRASISPWDAVVVGLPPDVILALARNYAGQFKLKNTLVESGAMMRPRILYISADMGQHPTAHLMSAELMEMKKAAAASGRAEMFLMCVAKPDRLSKLMSSSAPYRAELKRVYGKDFLEYGHLSDKEIAERIHFLRPQIIYLAGFHQDGDRIAVLQGLTGAIIVQGVAHASTSGSKGVNYLLCNEQVLPEKNQKLFSEKPLYIKAPFLPNSFRVFFGHHADRLSELRNDVSIRCEARNRSGMPQAKIIANISKPNRLDKKFFDLAIKILEANPDAVLILIDHGYPAFKQRKLASFNALGMRDRLVFVPHLDLENGDLHRFLALIDVYLDTPVYNSHTACHDSLWANGVHITIEGESLAARIGADLLHHFGTPENICSDAAAALARVNDLLQDPIGLLAARKKAERCRAASKMYDNAHRAEIVLDALLRAFKETVKNQEQEKELACSASASQHLSEIDVTFVSTVMDGLGIRLRGTAEDHERFIMLRGEFRGVQVVIKVGKDLDVPPQDNPAFREVLARDGKQSEFGPQIFSQLLPLNETHAVDREGDLQLDVIQFQLSSNGKTAFAVIEEAQPYPAAVVFDVVAEEWRRCPSEATVTKTASLLLAMIKALQCLHTRGKAYGGDPRRFKLSRLKDGFGKEALAYVVYQEQMYSLLLGDADRVMDRNIPCTLASQPASNVERDRGLASTRSAKIHTRSQNEAVLPVRASMRKIGSNASIPAGEIRSLLTGSGTVACNQRLIEQAQRDDLRRAGMAVWSAMLGRNLQETEVAAGKWQEAPALYRGWLATLSDDEFQQVTGLISRIELDDRTCGCFMKKKAQLAALFELLHRLLGDTELDAKRVLDSAPFRGMDLPFDAHPEGLDSAPEVVRKDLEACAPLMTQLKAKVMHYYVAARTVQWFKEEKQLIATWLVFMWDEGKKRYNRSLWSAQRGNEGELAAIYHSPLVLDEAHTTYLCPTHMLKFPTSKIVMDGRHRAFDDTPKAVADGIVAQFVNSSRTEDGMLNRTANCMWDWNMEWRKLGTTKPSQLNEVAMGVKLVRNVGMYEELHYPYYWGKYDKVSDHLLQLTQGGAPKGNAGRLRS